MDLVWSLSCVDNKENTTTTKKTFADSKKELDLQTTL